MTPSTSIKRRYGWALPAAGLVLLLAVPVLAAVISEKYYFEVPHTNERSMQAQLNLALGNVQIGRAERGYLFQAQVDLEHEHMKPQLSYENRGRQGRLRLELSNEDGNRRGISIRGLSSAKSSQWILLFGTQTPLDLKIEMGLARGEFDMTGLPIARFELDSGVSNTHLFFTEANPVAMEQMRIKAGASEFTATGLGYARARRFSFEGGAGRFNLDFSGNALPSGARADINVGMASLSVALPANSPVVLRVPESWLTRVELPVDYVKKGSGVWHSLSVKDEQQALQVNVQAGVGTVRFHTTGLASSSR